MEAGVDVFRLNFSHIPHKDAVKAIHDVRTLNSELGTSVALLAYLLRPMSRTGKMKEREE